VATPNAPHGAEGTADGSPAAKGTTGDTTGAADEDQVTGRRVDGMTVIVGAHPVPVSESVTVSVKSRDALARELWDLHYAPLAGWCAALVGDRDAAHDIASEAFTRLLAKWVTVRDPRGFLYVTATNLARDRWRREQRDRRLYARLELITPPSTPASDPWLRDLVERLPDRMRTPVLLHYYADMPIAEVAAALHRPQGTIKRTLSDARSRLLGWLENDE
jgi:RNA polymerase sigma-70 factor, ECF subfamily